MFSGFPETLRQYGFKTDVRTLLDMYRTMEMGLVTNLGSLLTFVSILSANQEEKLLFIHLRFGIIFWESILLTLTQLTMLSANLLLLNTG